MSITQEIINDLKKKPGRPRSDSTMSPADKQRAYRDRLKLKQQLVPSKDLVYQLQEELEKFKTLNKLLSVDLQHARREAEKYQLQVWDLEIKLSKKSNVTKTKNN